MTGSFGIENKTNGQRIRSVVVGQLVIQLIAPQAGGLPGAQIVKHHADHIWPFSWNGDKLEILQDDASKGEISSGHDLPAFALPSRPAHFCTNMCSLLSINRPLSRNAIRMILAGLISGQFGSPYRPTGAGKFL